MNYIHTSESLKKQDSDFENYHYQLEDGEQYRLTNGELGWLSFVSGKYAIADHICDNMIDDVYNMDRLALSASLKDDGVFPKAVCLSDDTALQAIFFYSAL